MGKIKRFILVKKWDLYHELAYRHFDLAEKYPIDSDGYIRHYKKYEKYMNKRINVHCKIYEMEES